MFWTLVFRLEVFRIEHHDWKLFNFFGNFSWNDSNLEFSNFWWATRFNLIYIVAKCFADIQQLNMYNKQYN